MLPSVDILYLALQADMDGDNMEEIIEVESGESMEFGFFGTYYARSKSICKI